MDRPPMEVAVGDLSKAIIFKEQAVSRVEVSASQGLIGERCMVKLQVRDRETIQDAVRRFRKLVERSGLKKEMRRREFYEKPSEIKRRSKQRAERRNRRIRLHGA
jgi:small subunit ribosomal protein S21